MHTVLFSSPGWLIIIVNDVELPNIRGIFREEMEAIEANAYLKGTTPEELMIRAGTEVANYLNENYNFSEKKIMVLASAGNNGGDALVVSRLLKGYESLVVIQVAGKDMKSVEGKKVRDDLTCTVNEVSQLELKILSEESLPEYKDWEPVTLEMIIEEMGTADVIIDGIFGFKLASPVREPYLSILNTFSLIFPEVSEDEEAIVTFPYLFCIDILFIV